MYPKKEMTIKVNKLIPAPSLNYIKQSVIDSTTSHKYRSSTIFYHIVDHKSQNLY